MGQEIRQEGFYKVLVKEFGDSFWTIGLWSTTRSTESGYWMFAEGDGDEQGACFTVIEVKGERIMGEREYQ